ncbi:MAG: malonate--CoA ligase [Pseudomonadales bacterium]
MKKDESFARALDTVATRYPERPALILDQVTWSYAKLTEWSARMAAVLRNTGVSPGDRVLVQVDKSAHAVALYLGCLRVGAVFVPLNTAYTTEEIRYFLGDADPALVVCRPADLDERERLAGSVPVLSLGADTSGSLLDAAQAVAPDFRIEPRTAVDLAAIVYTSGTTGRSKGAMLSHANLESSARVLVEAWGWRDDDVLLHALPIFHVHGLFVALHCVLLTGTAMVFMPGFDAEAVLEALPRTTVMMGVPTFYTRLLEHPGLTADRCTHIRLFISGSAPRTPQPFEACEARTGQRILERYGMSETMMNTSNPLLGERVAGTVGFPLPGTEVRVADSEGRVLGADEVGVLEVRGPNVFSGYWRMPEKNTEEFRGDGFFITGDLGRIDASGRVTIVGRAKDLIISGGYNVYPKEVEERLDELAGVTESAVIGVPHPDFGEAVVAVIVPAQDPVTENDVRAALADRLARFKQPKAVINVPTLPRNAMGKVQKKALRERYGDLFASSVQGA